MYCFDCLNPDLAGFDCSPQKKNGLQNQLQSKKNAKISLWFHIVLPRIQYPPLRSLSKRHPKFHLCSQTYQVGCIEIHQGGRPKVLHPGSCPSPQKIQGGRDGKFSEGFGPRNFIVPRNFLGFPRSISTPKF